MAKRWNHLKTSSSLIMSAGWADMTQRLNLLTGTPTGVLASSQYGGLCVIRLGTFQFKYFNKQGKKDALPFRTHLGGYTVLIPVQPIGQSSHDPAHIQEEGNGSPPTHVEGTKSRCQRAHGIRGAVAPIFGKLNLPQWCWHTGFRIQMLILKLSKSNSQRFRLPG